MLGLEAMVVLLDNDLEPGAGFLLDFFLFSTSLTFSHLPLIEYTLYFVDSDTAAYNNYW